MMARTQTYFRHIVLSALLLTAWDAVAGEIQSLAWEGDAVLKITVSGDAPFEVSSHDDGLRARISFPGSTVGPNLDELGSSGFVKGVFPYLSDNGTAVSVDLLLTSAGRVDVQKTAGGYRVAAVSGAAATAAERPPAPPAAPAAEVAPAVVIAPVAPAAPSKTALQEIQYTKLPGDRVQVVLRMSGPPTEPAIFKSEAPDKPARVVFDFPGTRVALPKKSYAVREGALTSIDAGEDENRTRIVLNLVRPAAHSANAQGNNFVITLDAPRAAIAGAQKPKVTHFASARKGGRYGLTNIDFRRGSQGEGKITIGLSDPAVGIDIREQAGEIVIDFLDTSVPTELQRRLDVVDFATPVQTIDTFAQGKNTRMIVVPKGKFEHSAYQAGNVFTVNFRPVIEKVDQKKADEFGYTGEKLSLNFQNIDVRAALQVLADFTNLNFVVSDTVKGNLTLRLKDVPWDQALDLIVDSKGLAVRRRGNVVTVAPAAEVAAKEKAALEASKSNLELEPLVSELIQVNYAKAEDIANLLKSIKPVVEVSQTQHPVFGAAATGQGIGAAGATIGTTNTLLSPRGQVTVDARSNSILVQDTPGKIREIRKLIAQLDQPIRQVMVETRLVEATDNFARSLGARFGHLTDSTGSGTRGITTGSLDPTVGNYVNTGTFQYVPGGLNVNLPAQVLNSKSPGVFSLTLFRGANILDLELSALEQEGKGKIISSPRVITATQKKAKIEQGQERVFTTTVLGAGSVVTKKATLKLEVTPQITPDERVNLDVVISKDNFVDAVTGLLNVKEITTQVLLDNGETVVIGGIFEQDRNDSITQVPFFGDIPLLGWLFKTKDVRDNKTELLVFLTPRILSDKLAVR
jgi:type IV pilus assembly protein PilQ